MTTTMKAVQFNRFGGPEVLHQVTLPVPALPSGALRVRVRAAGVNFFETLVRQERYPPSPELPVVPGVEVAGEVDAVGPGVDAGWIGARVAVPLFALGRPSGGYAEYVVAEAASVIRLPDGLAFEDATALMIQGLAAWHLVQQSRPSGKTVLISAAAGGVGSLLVQLAAAAGARRIVAVAGSSVKIEAAMEVGAHAGVDHTRPGWATRLRESGGSVDIVYDTVGGPFTADALDALADGGELMFAALNRFELMPPQLEAMFERNQSLRGFALLPLLKPETLTADVAGLFERAASGALKLLPAERFSFDQAAAAHAAIESRRTRGKVVLVP
ncbi:zinc-binding alcohol dehydrogenase family protein [Variovorax sp. J2P1-59]|uniref:quinone oxidoreductase family protein n=1 Tax=Variovorax flavidus TaxID=3053501 RepID=UPI00257657BD|nr:zinc-binding alcohol dehydrogenase family protein [Variovorax sp. J2P1-59]MDM0074802.1 zinc-binding alcohol dehydrogenase family protein [Variovorax sp. J2P1-59]